MPAPSTPVRRSKRLIRWLAPGWTFVWTVCTARNAPRNWRSQRFGANGVSDQLSEAILDVHGPEDVSSIFIHLTIIKPLNPPIHANHLAAQAKKTCSS
ncbi:Hypothetical predicted protein [Cloeon dipterum]|uniref:Uncharacterized protein n=1 Tax=Cloeon dipterum TaxID=197152 RepID=A0A8S1D9Z1_9INSE|nr:Hypothetical predicted protein [Cloeon dipterum]